MGRPIKDLAGKRFGRLKVLSFCRVGPKHAALWSCLCSCGKPTVVLGSRLTNGVTKSCGCLRLETVKFGDHHKRAWKEGTTFRAVLYQYKSNAKARGLCWELTDEQFRELTSSPCYYTGDLPSRAKKAEYNSGDIYVYNGIDRIDNTKGYTPENCVPCCFEVNAMKRDFSEQRFIELCAKVAEKRHRGYT